PDASPGRPAEERLPGGFIAEVVRVGDTVRRTPPADLDFVAALLRHLERVGADLAPRHLGVDERGRQVLSHLDGRVPWRDREDPAFSADPALTRLAALIRRLHDACAGTALAGDAETVCHRDLSPKNTVYRDSPAGPLPAAFLDWDLAGPGRRVEDVAFAAWHWARLGPDADPVELGRRCRLLCDAYDAAVPDPGPDHGPDPAAPEDLLREVLGGQDRTERSAAPDRNERPALDRAELVDVMLTQLDGTWRGIAAGADAGDPGMVRLRAAGVPPMIRGWHDWLAAHRRRVEAALAGPVNRAG
ncbi:aminoglycoside phosphotransferase family protein, partial [Micromonospora phytophila]|uniref:phosphotransferase n=1 Tax=Micromonospora phytophila TaxID=709888 RepID=UPI0020309EE7